MSLSMTCLSTLSRFGIKIHDMAVEPLKAVRIISSLAGSNN